MNPLAGAQFLLSAARLDQLPPPDRPEAAFAGRSNAGKSSALNALCSHGGLARVSRTPGRTQLLNFFEITPGGIAARLVDLPGYGYAQVGREQRRDWGPVIGGYVEHRSCLRGLVLVSDVRHALTDFDRQLLAWAFSLGRPVHVLLTKADKLGRGAAGAHLAAVRKELPKLHAMATAQLFSATAGAGVDEARELVAGWLTAPGSP